MIYEKNDAGENNGNDGATDHTLDTGANSPQVTVEMPQGGRSNFPSMIPTKAEFEKSMAGLSEVEKEETRRIGLDGVAASRIALKSTIIKSD